MKNIGWKELTSKLLLETPFFKLHRKDFQRPDGTVIQDYYLMEKPFHVHIVALTEDRKVVLIKHYRPGTGTTELELPAGYVKPGENLETACQRELLEETGYTAKLFQEVSNFAQDSSRFIGYTGHLFLARNLTKASEEVLSGDSEKESMEIEGMMEIGLEKALEMVDKGEIKDLIAIAGLFSAQRFLTQHGAIFSSRES